MAPQGPDQSEPPADQSGAGSRRAFLGRWMLGGLGVLTAVVGVLLGSVIWLRSAADGHEFAVADAPAAPVAIVFGAGISSAGVPTPALRVRLEDAAALYRAGKVKVLLVSGDNGTTSHDEPTVMRNHLEQLGVPASRIVLDYAGFDTWDTCVRAKRIFGVDRALVVTQQFHLSRAVFLCRQAGIDADGAADPHPSEDKTVYHLREYPAAVKAAWDALWQPDPKFLGRQEDGVRIALKG